MIMAATRSDDTAAVGLIPKKITRIGVMSAPPPMPVIPTTKPTIAPASTMAQSICTRPILRGHRSSPTAQPRSIQLVVDASRSDADEQLAELTLTEEEKLVLAKVAEILRKIQFGTVVLVVQDGKVVQVEMAEKFRLR